MAAVVFACLAGFGFGALAVAVRIGYRREADPTVAPFAISVIGLLVVAVAAAASGAFERSTIGSLWPFFVIGLAIPGASQLLFVRAIRDAGPSRAAVLIGVAPLISAALAVLFLGEPLGPALGIATVLIVAGGALLAWERARPPDFRIIGIGFALLCAVIFALRDNLVRLAERDNGVPGLAATTASLAGAAVALGVIVLLTQRDRRSGHLRAVAIAFIPAGLCIGLAYATLIEAFDRGRVTVVAPLNATQSLWAVVISAALLGRGERIGPRLVLASLLVVSGGVLIGLTR